MQNQETPTPQELKKRFGQDADLYAEVRADAADMSGRPDAAKQWVRLSECLHDEADDDE